MTYVPGRPAEVDELTAPLSELTIEQIRSKLWGLGAELSLAGPFDSVSHIYEERDVLEAELTRRAFQPGEA